MWINVLLGSDNKAPPHRAQEGPEVRQGSPICGGRACHVEGLYHKVGGCRSGGPQSLAQLKTGTSGQSSTRWTKMKALVYNSLIYLSHIHIPSWLWDCHCMSACFVPLYSIRFLFHSLTGLTSCIYSGSFTFHFLTAFTYLMQCKVSIVIELDRQTQTINVTLWNMRIEG